MSGESIWKTPAQGRHALRVGWAAAAYGALLILVLAIHMLGNTPVGAPWRAVLALLPAVPLVGMFASYARYLNEETDEYLRTLVMRNFVTATMIAMTCAVVWGFLNELGGAPPIATYWIAVVWIVVQFAGALIARVRGA
jgi:hypothetical protein